MHRAKWMTSSAYNEFIERWADEDGKVRCVGIGWHSSGDARTTVEHTVARSANGTDELSNLQPLCDICNSRKGDRPDD
jgi:hypothetical protein